MKKNKNSKNKWIVLWKALKWKSFKEFNNLLSVLKMSWYFLIWHFENSRNFYFISRRISDYNSFCPLLHSTFMFLQGKSRTLDTSIFYDQILPPSWKYHRNRILYKKMFNNSLKNSFFIQTRIIFTTFS